jgi:hypothetical protein
VGRFVITASKGTSKYDFIVSPNGNFGGYEVSIAMFIRNIPIKLLLIIAACAALAVFSPFVMGIYQRHRAATFLREFVALRIGTTTFAEAQELANKYGARSSGIHVRNACSIEDCAFDFVFKNWLLNNLQHEREISLSAGLIINNGIVTSRELDYSILETSADHQFMYILFDRLKHDDKGYTIKHERVDAQGLAHDIEIDLSPNAPEEIRRRAYSLNLSCLYKAYDCNTPSAITPSRF